MRISDWSSDVCSSDLLGVRLFADARALQAGEYAFAAESSMREAASRIASGRTVVHRLTVPEGLTSTEVVALLAAAEPLTGEIATMPPDGALLPETNHFHRGDSREDVLERMQPSMDAVLAELWQARQEDLPLDGPAEVLTLASIIETEAGVNSERALVASVFVNSLRKGKQLRSDPPLGHGLNTDSAPLSHAQPPQ